MLVSTHIDYRRPIRLFDRPVGRMWMSAVSRARWTVQAEILLNGQLAAVAVQVGGFVSLETLRPIRLPGELRSRFLQEWGDQE